MGERVRITCRQLIDFIADYVDGDLDDRLGHVFESHLAHCRSCRAYLESYRKTLRFTRAVANDIPLDDVPDELVKLILGKR